jgi:hypothetical protein
MADHIDPVTGRPLHEFVVDPLAVPPTAIPTEGEPNDEPGSIAMHDTKRGRPRLVAVIDPELDPREAAKELVRLIRNAGS